MAILTGMRSELSRDQLLCRHLEATVTVHRPHRLVGPADLGPDGGGHGEAHGAEAAGVHPGVGVVELPPLGGEHLVLADPGGHDGVLGRGVAQGLQHELGLEGTGTRLLLVDQWIASLPLAERRPPWHEPLPRERRSHRAGGGRGPGNGIARRPSPSTPGGVAVAQAQVVEGGQELVDDQAAVAGDGHVGVADLVELGRIDVDVDDLGLRGEGVDPAGDPVVEPAPEGDQQVGALHGWSPRCSCHACPASRGTAGGSRGSSHGPSGWSRRGCRSARPAPEATRRRGT